MTLKEEIQHKIDQYRRDRALRMLSGTVLKQGAFERLDVRDHVKVLNADWPPLPEPQREALEQLERLVRETHAQWQGDPDVKDLDLDDATVDEVVRHLLGSAENL